MVSHVFVRGHVAEIIINQNGRFDILNTFKIALQHQGGAKIIVLYIRTMFNLTYEPLMLTYAGGTLFTAWMYWEKEWLSAVMYFLSAVLYGFKWYKDKAHVPTDKFLYSAIALSYVFAAVVH
jgi:hypothetical protein